MGFVLAGASPGNESAEMDAYFAELGREVAKRWQEANFSLSAFPEIAQKILEERPPAEQVNLDALMRDFLGNDEQPFQTSSGFGQPELVVYDHPRFAIQVLFWLEGTTQIHQHEFSGAFHVLEGSSLQAGFAFENVQPVSAHFQLGDLRLKSTRLLPRGSTVSIVSGRDQIHSLFHLETPSVTVVIRTHCDQGAGPQFTYLPPHLAVDPFLTDALTTRRTQLLDVFEQTGHPDYQKQVTEMLGELDLERGFFILQNGYAYLQSLGVWDEVWEVFSRRHGPLAKGVLPSLEETVRRDTLVAYRRSVTDPAHRFFLALVLTLSERGEIFSQIGQRHPGPPEETIRQWLLDLCESAEGELHILDAVLPPDIQAEDELVVALKQLLESGHGPLQEAFLASSLRVLLPPADEKI